MCKTGGAGAVARRKKGREPRLLETPRSPAGLIGGGLAPQAFLTKQAFRKDGDPFHLAGDFVVAFHQADGFWTWSRSLSVWEEP